MTTETKMRNKTATIAALAAAACLTGCGEAPGRALHAEKPCLDRPGAVVRVVDQGRNYPNPMRRAIVAVKGHDGNVVTCYGDGANLALGAGDQIDGAGLVAAHGN